MNMMDIYRINIAGELVMSAVLVFLLITCVLQRKRFVTAKPLSVLISLSLLLLLCQVAEWLLMIRGGNQTVGTIPAFRSWKILTYTLDYALGYSSSVAFYRYTGAHIGELYRQSGKQYADSDDKWMKFLFLWGIAATVLFCTVMNQDWFYFLQEDGTETFHRGAYVVLYAMAFLVTVFVAVKLIRHRKILGIVNFVLLLLYKVSPTALLLLDITRGTCLSYLMRAFYAFILYVHVDLRGEKIFADREVQIAKQEKELFELRTKIMLSQMQPHFLYNTLTTISSLCYLENAQQARQVVDKFCDYFRENMDSMGKDKFIHFEKELKHIETYLWIEQVRFDDALAVVYKIGPRDFMLPSLTLQPLVENAVKHGIRKKKGGGTVTIETRETPEEYTVIISDDGAGFDPNEKPDDGRSHIGIENITSRLEILCSGRLEIRSVKGEGTVATVHVPKEKINI